MKKMLIIFLSLAIFITLLLFRNEILVKFSQSKEPSVDYYSYCWGPGDYCSKWKQDICEGRSAKKVDRIPDGPDMTCYGQLIKQ